jgi:hypothetical protein
MIDINTDGYQSYEGNYIINPLLMNEPSYNVYVTIDKLLDYKFGEAGNSLNQKENKALKPGLIPITVKNIVLRDTNIADMLTSVHVPSTIYNCDFLFNNWFPNCRKLILKTSPRIDFKFDELRPDRRSNCFAKRFTKEFFSRQFPQLRYFHYSGIAYPPGYNTENDFCFGKDMRYKSGEFTVENISDDPRNDYCVFEDGCFEDNESIETVGIKDAVDFPA